METEKRKRSTKVSVRQQNLMVDFISENRSMQILAANDTKWEELAATLNQTPGAKKPVDQWRRTFIEWKSKIKKKARNLVANQKQTGGGVDNLEELTEVEKKLLSLVGQSSVAGDPLLCEAGIPDNEPLSPVQGPLVTTPETVTNQATDDTETIILMTENSDMDNTPDNVNVVEKVAVKRKHSSHSTTPIRHKTQKRLLPQALQQYSTATDAFNESINNLAAGINKLANAVELLAKSLQ